MTNESATQYECSHCEWIGIYDGLEWIRGIDERVGPREFMPAGECPDCGALISAAEDDVSDYVLEAAISIAQKRSQVFMVGVKRYTLFLQSSCGYACGDHEMSSFGRGWVKTPALNFEARI